MVSFLKSFTIILISLPGILCANPTSSGIYLELQKFQSLKKVLYVAAHPDDENTRALAWFSLDRKAETAYFSLTRGDGGQNLIGNELSEDLGILRTQELLAARSYDKAEQYFARAVDFGYSKSAEETFEKWGKEAMLEDAVLMIRKFRPDVIVTRFSPDPYGGHGHHTASALIAVEAFDKAADPGFLPEQVREFGTWQATAIYWNASSWWNTELDSIARNNPDYLVVDIGGYSSILGQSYNEIGTIARSQHKCQGFGALIERGSRIEYFQHLAGEKLKEDFFERNDRTWASIVDAAFESQLNTLLEAFDFVNTENNVIPLLDLHQALDKLPDSVFKRDKIAALDKIILDCLGMHVEINSDDYAFPRGDSAAFRLNLINRSSITVSLVGLNGVRMDTDLPENEEVEKSFSIVNEEPVSNPYWLKNAFTDLFTVEEDDDLLKAESDPTFAFPVALEVLGTRIRMTVPVEYKWRDPSYGERRRPAISTPDFSAGFDASSVILRPGQTRSVTLKVHSFRENLTDTIAIKAPDGWQVSVERIPVAIAGRHAEKLVNIEITAGDDSERGYLELFDSEGSLLMSYKEIAYDHIPTQVVFKPSKLECIKIEAAIRPGKVAYIKGVDDAVPRAIEQLGFEVELFEVEDVPMLDLSPYQSVVLGIRIYNVHEELKNSDDKLFDYVKGGGNLVMQYNTASWRAPGTKFGGPLPFELSRNRVTEEDAEVTFLRPDHPIMNYPNKLDRRDFDDWVQERGLYFADNWDEAFTPLFSWHDKGEDAQLGALIVADYGAGRFIYTGISFFRELPNGVEGAYRLFANLLSYE